MNNNLVYSFNSYPLGRNFIYDFVATNKKTKKEEVNIRLRIATSRLPLGKLVGSEFVTLSKLNKKTNKTETKKDSDVNYFGEYLPLEKESIQIIIDLYYAEKDSKKKATLKKAYENAVAVARWGSLSDEIYEKAPQLKKCEEGS